MTNALSFSERRKKLLESREEHSTPSPVQSTKPLVKLSITPSQFESSVPDVEEERSEQDQQITAAINTIEILTAYQKWIGKEIDMSTTDRVEGVMVSCPKPNHRDSNPSAWINQSKKTWFCGTCQEGGDIYDMAAYSKGYDVPGYKSGSNFHRLREDMAADFGTYVKKLPGGDTLVWSEDTHELANPVTSLATSPIINPDVGDPDVVIIPAEVPEEESNVVDLPVVNIDYEDREVMLSYATIDWRKMVPEDTFLREYLEACSHDDSPEEYHFWHGLVALGHAVGRNVTLKDSKAVSGNLLLCLLGGTGYGKSRSRTWLDEVMKDVLPFTDNGLDTSGVKVIPIPASGEYLVKQFQHQAADPSLPRSTGIYTSVNGIVDFDEFAGLLARANRPGATLKPTIMGFADCVREVKIGSMTSGEFHAYMPFCSIIASTQPKAVRTLLSKQDTGSGFLNRWIFAGGHRKERKAFSTTFSIDLARAKDQLKKVRGYGATERSIDIAPDALEAIERFFKSTLYPVQENDSTDLLKRIDLMFKKLLLLFTINNREKQVTLDTFNRILPLLNYMIKNYKMIDAEIGITLGNEIADDILRHAERHFNTFHKGVSARDISRYTQSRKYTVQLIRRTLDDLVAIDLLVTEKAIQGAVGRPTIRYRVPE